MDKKIITVIEKQVAEFNVPIVTKFAAKNDPYKVLISCLLSLRTKDETTASVSKKLFAVADTPRKVVKLTLKKLETLIYPVGFYRNKAKTLLDVSRRIIKEYKGQVPDTLEDLLGLSGVGLKTANLVLGLGYNIPAICVDTHVHRISNRLGWIKTKKPEDSEKALKLILPKTYWIDLNTILVTFGQNICKPISPLCGSCAVDKYCPKLGVGKHR